ncbi:MAG: 5'/3'-nucleotidase SurE [Spirochaetales bacterium]
MNILLTNDDGIKSPGLWSLKNILDPHHQVFVVAPDGERSGTSHRITLKGPIQLKQIEEGTFSCSGSPADCVIVGLLSGKVPTPDIVVSGINIGPNLGTDLIYSGTAAAARQAVLMGKPAVALSLNSFQEPFLFDSLSSFLRDNIELILRLWDRNHFLNINAPNQGVYKGVRITHPCRRIYHDKLVEFQAPDHHLYFFIEGMEVETLSGNGSDWEAVREGYLSISPIFIHPVTEKEDERYRNAPFRLHEA